MDKILKKIITLFTVCGIVALSIVSSFAETVYVVNGYSFNIVNNNSIALCGWDNRTPELIVPDTIAERTVVSVADYGFEYNEGITSVDFSYAEHLRYIGIDAFRNCTGINSEITVPATLTAFGERAFQGCSSIPSVVINANVTSIPKQCFYQCTALESVELPGTLTKIEPFAFADCSALSYVVVPANVSSIATTSFQNDPNLTFGVFYDSYAHTFAKDNNIPYKLLDEFKLGDVDDDGYVNINDVTEIQRNLAELEDLNELQMLAADINRDGSVDVEDATVLQRFLAEYEVTYPIGEVITQ